MTRTQLSTFCTDLTEGHNPNPLRHTHLRMNRRDLLKLSLTLPCCEMLGAAWPGKAALGANTAITGMGFFEAVGLLQDLKFPVIEIQATGVLEPQPGKWPGFEFDRLSLAQREAMRNVLRNFQHVTIHLPYTGLNYFTSPATDSAASLERLRHAMDGAAYFGCKVAVMHTTELKGMDLASARPAMVKAFRQWGDRAAAGKFRLAVETNTGSIPSARAFIEFIQEIDHPHVGCTLDVGHEIGYEEFKKVPAGQRSAPQGLRAYNDLILQLVDRLGPKLFHLHVHDIDPSNWKDHVPVGTGVIDYPRLMTALKKSRYEGFFILEIAAPDMHASLAKSKQLMEGYLSSLDIREAPGSGQREFPCTDDRDDGHRAVAKPRQRNLRHSATGLPVG